MEPNFEQSINLSLKWIKEWEKGELSEEILADRIFELIKYFNGARAFLVAALTSDGPLLDRLPEQLLLKFNLAGESFIDLIVKNLAMSSAMTEYHKQNNDIQKMNKSDQISFRCIELMRNLDTSMVKRSADSLRDGLKGIGQYAVFLEKNGYKEYQKVGIKKKLFLIAKEKGANAPSKGTD
tara:strand:+ start:4328 stop:4870 length:543 start_codon:yes stop_codon:yes gene_type:complete